jgi:hypothetical protein
MPTPESITLNTRFSTAFSRCQEAVNSITPAGV